MGTVNVAGDTQRAEAIALATTLSRVSQLVRALAGEMLNSAEGSVRLEAVRLLPLLHGHTSRDIADKLLAMMWGDLHAEVGFDCSCVCVRGYLNASHCTNCR